MFASQISRQDSILAAFGKRTRQMHYPLPENRALPPKRKSPTRALIQFKARKNLENSKSWQRNHSE
jgi:hypothetical protein